MRHRVRSVSYKGRSARGEPAEWITIEPVARAVEIQNACRSAWLPPEASRHSGPF